MELLICSALFLPLAGFIILLALSEQLSRRIATIIGPGTILASFFCFAFIFFSNASPRTITLFSWIPLETIKADMSIHLDSLALLMSLIVTGVGFLIHLYSIGYMEHDRDITRYFSSMNFFIFSMLLLVLAENLLVFFVGWEGVGLASYLLIGFWYPRPAAAKAAKKAFVVNRIGDLGLLMAILLTLNLFGTTSIKQVSELAVQQFEVGAPIIAVLCFLYFWGACGKSAQIPLHVWLADAMEGPTPVSALIHAATMVTAGVYLVVRMHALFLLSPVIMQLVAVVGIVTSLYASLSATSQTDIKRVLAYSTISQLGLMFAACGTGAFFAAMFHLSMHAFVKALLFLAAGNVIHMLHGTTEMAKMGGLVKAYPKTHLFFLIGVLSMSGIPPLALFFSKDLILEEIISYPVYYFMGLMVSFLTAFYLSRAYFMTFHGKATQEPTTASDAPKVMMIPVAILGVLSVIGGFLGFSRNSPPALMRFLLKDGSFFLTDTLTSGYHITTTLWISTGVALLGILTAALMYTTLKHKLGKTCSFLYHSFYFDAIYNEIIVSPLLGLSKLITQLFEPQFFDAAVQTTGQACHAVGRGLQKISSGLIRSYISWIVIGAAWLLLHLVFEVF